MPISEALLPEFDHEMAGTRKTLERVPEDKFGWKPHEKSMSMARLAQHLAEIPDWAVNTIEKDSLHIAPPGSGPFQMPPPPKSRQEVLEMFDKNVAAARKAIAGAADAHLMQPWTLQFQGKTLFTMPRIAVIRAHVMSHSIHHRAQLGVYLRLNNVAVPGMYGPSADEMMTAFASS
jgi:uncharacterized damage-inducible protein DinB